MINNDKNDIEMLSRSFVLHHNPKTNVTFSGAFEALKENVSNNNIYMIYFTNIMLSLFKYNNLPEKMNARYIEYCLFSRGGVALYRDRTNDDYFSLPYTNSEQLNIYMEPKEINVFSDNGAVNKTIKDDDFVIMRNNLTETPGILFVNYFVNRIAHTQQIIDINLNAQKTPVFIVADKNQQFSAIQLLDKYVQGVPVVAGNATMFDMLKVLKTDAPFLVDKLLEVKKSYVNDFLSFMGVNNVDSKKERLIVDEANANNEFININAQTMLLTRQQAVEDFNDKFGTDISVEMRSSDYFNNQFEDLQNEVKRGCENGEV